MAIVEMEDMIGIAELTEDAILNNLKRRFEEKKIYTYTGSILVGLNPFCSIEKLYSNETLWKYRGKSIQDGPPHVFAIAEKAYQNICKEQASQGIIISGESGAGKSETTKLVLQYLAAITKQKGEESWIEEGILDANTILESFGNAKTVRNDNSSRFGKFIQVLFSEKNQIAGANVINYLLEKSRVVNQAPNERNYHVFYELLRGASAAELKDCILMSANQYWYLSQGGAVDIKGTDDKSKFQSLKLAMTVLNFPETSIREIFQTLSAILWFGNINFEETADKESVRVSPATQDVLETIAKLLKIDMDQLAEVLTVRKLVILQETNLVPYKLSQACDNRDSIAKTLYERLFNKIVAIINSCLIARKESLRYIGVLDIFGFEVFAVNGFEQLCINYANEKLQQFFTTFIFKQEQAQYEREKISWDKIAYVDNQPCLDLIENPGGIYLSLDEETKMPKGTDDTWLDKMNNNQVNNKHFFRPKTQKGVFGIIHYAGEVVYTVSRFLEKNRDSIQDEVVDLFSKSDLEILSSVFMAEKQSEASSSQEKLKKGTLVISKGPPVKPLRRTAGLRFKGSLVSLMGTLGATTPHYVRCIKPNQSKRAMLFDNEQVLSQLRYSGMLDTIRIRKLGFSHRLPYADFLKKFRFIYDSNVLERSGPRASVEHALKAMGLAFDVWRPGQTMIFLRDNAFVTVTNRNNEFLFHFVVCIQKSIKGWLERRRYKKKQLSVVVLQKYTRRFIALESYRRTKLAIIRIQSVIRGWFARCFYEYLKSERLKEIGQAPIQVCSSENTIAHKELVILNISLPKGSILASSFHAVDLDDLFAVLNDPVPKHVKTNLHSIEDLSYMFDAISGQIDAVKKNVQKATKDRNAVAAMGNKFAKFVVKQMKEHGGKRIDPNSPELALEVYAERHFQKSLLKANKTWTQVWQHDKGIMKTAFHRLFEDDLEKKAIECFRNISTILDFSGKTSEESGPISALQFIISTGIQNPALRDEILACLVKQSKIEIQNDKQYRMLENAWLALALTTASAPPTKVFSRVFLAYLQRSVAEFAPKPLFQTVLQFAKRTEEALKNSMLHGSRKKPPSVMEIKAAISGMPLYCRVVLPNGKEKAVEIKSTATSSDVIKKVSTAIDLKDYGGWSIFETHHETMRQLTAGEYLCDTFTDWEENQRTSLKFTGYRTTRKHRISKLEISAAEKLALGGGDVKICLRKRLFKHSTGSIMDPVGLDLLFSQVAADIAKRNTGILSKVGIQLAALRMHIVHAKSDPRFVAAPAVGPRYLYAPIQDMSSGQVTAQIYSYYQKVHSMTLIQAMAYFLEVAKGWRFYGCALYPMKIQGFWSYSENVLINISTEEIQFIHPKTFQTIKSFRFRQIHTAEFDKDVLTIVTDPCGSEDEDEFTDRSRSDVYNFISPHASEIVLLMRDYSPLVAAKKNKERAEDFELLEKDIDRTRWHIVKDKIVRIPGPSSHVSPVDAKATSLNANETIANMFGTVRMIKQKEPVPSSPRSEKLKQSIKNTVRAISTVRGNSKGKGARSKAYQAKEYIPTKEEQQAMYSKADWSFSKVMLEHSIRTIPEDNPRSQDWNQWAISMFMILHIYAGLHPGELPEDKGSRVRHGTVIQNTFIRCMEITELQDEFFLQLLKSITNFPDADAAPVVKLWQLLVVACGVMSPSKNVGEYVKAHLGKHSVLEKERPLESKHATYALRLIRKNLVVQKRKNPPSINEIWYSMNLSPIRVKIGFPDGQFRSICIEPYQNMSEIYEIVKTKAKTQSFVGWAVFEIFAGMERHVQADEKLSDLLYKWEKFSKSSIQFAHEKVEFIFRQRLYVDHMRPSVIPEEENLMRHQTIRDIKKGLFPLEESEACYMAALVIQSFYGDPNTANIIRYDEVAAKYMPERFLKPNIHLELMKMHIALRSTSPEKADSLFMEYARIWPLFGATVFDVSQCYTTELPEQLWLLINVDGIHISARDSKLPLVTHSFKKILSCSTSPKAVMFVVGDIYRSTKYVMQTLQSGVIATLIKDYGEVKTKTATVKLTTKVLSAKMR